MQTLLKQIYLLLAAVWLTSLASVIAAEATKPNIVFHLR